MALVTSGDIHLKGSLVAPTRSIEYECEGAISGDFNMITANTIAGFTLPTNMTDFYGFDNCTGTVPGAVSSCSGADGGAVGICTYGTATGADNYRVQYAISPYTTWLPAADGGAYDLSSTYITTLANGSYRFRVAGENCNGLGAYTTSAIFVMS